MFVCVTQYPLLIRHAPSSNPPPLTLNRVVSLSIPDQRTLDIDLSLSDAEIVSRISFSINAAAPQKPLTDSQETRKDQETSRTLQLKRQCDFDVDAAEAEWKTGTEVVVICL